MTKKRSRILVVDDETVNIKVILELLSDDYDTAVAKNGEQALKRAALHPPDLILLDILMPDMDGYEICRRFKTDPKTENIPIIFLTALSDEEDETKGLGIGAIDYISKPFRPGIVKARVRNHLELKRRGDILQRLSSLDGLTGIPNRRSFDDFLDREWRRAIRNDTGLSLIMIDIDYFKFFNDHYGHAEGDFCLRRVGKTLAAALERGADMVARYGGEEFVCVLPETDLAGAAIVGEKLRRSVEALAIPHEKSESFPFVSISLGVACIFPNREECSGELVEAADRMLYVAKRRGRNRVCGDDVKE